MSIRHDRDLRYRTSRNKCVSKPKTFKTEVSAAAWAKTHNVSDYTLVNLRSSAAKIKKLRILIKAPVK